MSSFINAVPHKRRPSQRRQSTFTDVDPVNASLRAHRLGRLIPLISDPSSSEELLLNTYKDLEGVIDDEALKEAQEIEKENAEYKLIWLDGFIDLFFVRVFDLHSTSARAYLSLDDFYFIL
jgi:hypothetical protein